MKVSVVVPAYNAAQYLERCIASILSQTYRHIEVLIVNDGSIDETKDVSEKIAAKDNRVKVICKPNGGVSSARNTGISKATGDCITFVDADDWLEQDAIANMMRYMKEYKVDCVRTTAYVGYENREIPMNLTLREGVYYKENIADIIPSFIVGSEKCYVVLLLINRSAIDRLLPFDENIHMMEDVCYYMDLLSKVDSIYLADVKTYHYYKNDESISRAPSNHASNLYSVIDVNTAMTRILESAGLLNDTIKREIDRTHTAIISHYLYLMYRDAPQKEKVVADTLNQLHKNDRFIAIANNADIIKMPFRLRCTALFTLSNSPNSLLIMFKSILYIKKLLHPVRGIN